MITTTSAPASSEISEVHEVVLKHRPANISLHPSIHPSSGLILYCHLSILKLQKPLFWVAYHPCHDRVQMWIHPCCSYCHWNPLSKCSCQQLPQSVFYLLILQLHSWTLKLNPFFLTYCFQEGIFKPCQSYREFTCTEDSLSLCFPDLTHWK